MRSVTMKMTEPQARFFLLEDKFPLFCGGFGVGKTETLANCALRDALSSSDALIALYEPTFDLVRLILAPRMEEKLTTLGIRYKYNKQENIIYTSAPNCGDFVMRTLENPGRIVGYESYRAHVDEIDTLKRDLALNAWQKVMARNRQKPKGIEKPFNRVSAYTTPEGFKFAYEMWAKDPKPGYVMVQAPTMSNPFLPEDYVETLRASYPPQLIDAYLLGKFVNLTSGAVYPDFDRHLHHTDSVIMPGEPIHVGVDFNVYNCTAIVCVDRADYPIILDELTGVRDTPALAQALVERFPGHHITAYPDASGRSHKSVDASLSDLQILRNAGITVRVNSKNPSVKDRVNAVNAQILSGDGIRHLQINTNKCPVMTECFEQQVFDKNGDPDKSAGKDHAPDAVGYFIAEMWPLHRPSWVF